MLRDKPVVALVSVLTIDSQYLPPLENKIGLEKITVFDIGLFLVKASMTVH